MVCLVTGAAGFIGVNLVDRLLREGRTVVAADRATGALSRRVSAASEDRLQVVAADLADRNYCERVFTSASALGAIEEVWHLAANSDIARGVVDPDLDLKDTFLTTFEIVRQTRRVGAGALYFASSSAIYGDLRDRELHEEIGPVLPISNYGAMKLASEAVVSAAAEAGLDRALLYRFPNVVGAPATHGVILDLIGKLKRNGSVLPVLGDGSQRKPYLHVSELIDAMMIARDAAGPGVTALNIGPEDPGVTVRWLAERVAERVSPGARLEFGFGDRGWVGDVPRFRYSIARMRSLGWRPLLSSDQAVTRAIDEVAVQEGV